MRKKVSLCKFVRKKRRCDEITTQNGKKTKSVKNLLLKYVENAVSDTNINIELKDKEKHKRSEDSFHRAMSKTLVVASVLGLFPTKGLLGKNPCNLNYRLLSIVGILSLATIAMCVWAALLSMTHTAISLIKATAGKSGGFANATSGGIFYLNAAVAAILFHLIAKRWPILMASWEKQEFKTIVVPPVHKLIRALAIIVFILALNEHLLSIAINTSDCQFEIKNRNYTLRACLKEYSLRSHGFIFASVPYSLPLGIFIFYISKVATFAWNFQDVFLMEICLGLLAQFKLVNKSVAKIDPESCSPKDWKYVRELYNGCTDLTRSFNKTLSPLVLLSFANNLYFICLQMLNGLTPELQGSLQYAYFFGSFGFMVSRLICVTMIAAAVPLEAKKALPNLRCCPTNAYSSEVQRLSHQLASDDVSFTGMGFFSINRNFMLAMAGAIATYEVVLLQFDTGQKT